jgi:hypothetical protein
MENETKHPTESESARRKAKEAIRKLRARKLRARMDEKRIDASLTAHGMGQESAMNDVVKPALAIIAELCSAIETHHIDQVNDFVENARKRARDFLEANGLE